MGKLVDELLTYLSKASSEQLAKDWYDLKEFNKIGPEASSFIECSQEVLNEVYSPLLEIRNPSLEGIRH